MIIKSLLKQGYTFNENSDIKIIMYLLYFRSH